MKEISGVAVATITPFGPGGLKLDTGFIAAHLELLEHEGAHGIVPVGSNGEFPSLTMAEKKKVLKAAAAARGGLFLLAGAGSSSLPETLELLDFAAAVGADGALVVPPFYFRDVSTAGVVEFYRGVLGHTSLPVFLYNIPMYTGIPITNEIVDSLLDYSNLAGIKDTGGDPSRTRELVRRYPHLRIFGGSDSLTGQAIETGAQGVITGVGNVFPGLVRAVWDARRGGGDVSAPAAKVRAVRQVIKSLPWIAATKYGVSLRGLPETFVRPPQVDLSRKQKQEMKDRLEELGVL